MTTRTATYARLKDGGWGIRVRGPVAPGDRVSVRKRDGEVKSEVVCRVITTDGDASLCTIDRRFESVRTPTSRKGSGRCRAPGCGNSATQNAPHCRAGQGYCGWCLYDEQ